MNAYPDSSTPYFYYGRASSLSGLELARGETSLRKFLAMLGETEPQSRAVAHYRLGMILERQGNVATARAEYDSAVALNPRYEDALAARKRLGK